MGLHWKSQTSNPGYIETNKPTVVVVNGGNQVVQQTTTTTTEPVKSGVNINLGGPYYVSFNTGASNNATTTQQTTTVVSTPAVSNAALPCSGTILGESDFASALKSIQMRSTIEGKILSSKQIVSNNCLSVVQIKSILKILNPRELKLDVAKYAYNNTIDKGNYFKLNDVFTTETSINELNKAIIK